MNFNDFVKLATQQDNRNTFSEYEGDLEIVPEHLKTFYNKFNPVDVEIEIDLGALRLYSAEKLNALQNEYQYVKAQFVFATINSDPVFLNDGRLYICAHGVKAPNWELIDLGKNNILSCFQNQMGNVI